MSSFDDILRFQSQAKELGVCWLCLEMEDKAKKEGKDLPEVKALKELPITTEKKELPVFVCENCDAI